MRSCYYFLFGKDGAEISFLKAVTATWPNKYINIATHNKYYLNVTGLQGKKVTKIGEKKSF